MMTVYSKDIATKLIDGKAYAASLRRKVSANVSQFSEMTGRVPGLAVILVGDDPASAVYVNSKHKMTTEVGMKSFQHILPSSISQDELLLLIKNLNADQNVDGILVQLPLPKHIDKQKVIDTIDPSKDVDGFHVINAGKLAVGDKSALVPCTPFGCLMLLREELGELSGKHAVIVGRSNIVGKPMAQLLLQENCTISIVHSRTENIVDIVSQADIVVSAVGQPSMIDHTWIKPGATVIDVGINRLPPDNDGKSKIVGDVATQDILGIARAITPVPGGVGPMTIAVLLRNTLVAAFEREKLNTPNPM